MFYFLFKYNSNALRQLAALFFAAQSVTPTEGCPAETDTDWKIVWPVAAIGSTQSVRCPGEGDVPGLGLAHRSCLTGSVWGSVDASDCGSVAVREVSMQVR